MTTQDKTRNQRFNASMLSVEALIEAYAQDNSKAAIFSDHGENAARHYAYLDGETRESAALKRASRRYQRVCRAMGVLQARGKAELVPTLWLIYANRGENREASVTAIMCRRRGRGRTCSYNVARRTYNYHREQLIKIFVPYQMVMDLTPNKGN